MKVLNLSSRTRNNKKLKNTKRKYITRKQLLKRCELPDIPETAHCFADSTHHTCCQLGSQAREYADSTGNPIGQLSKRIAITREKSKTKSSNNLTPWCTCTGSQVCTYYTKKFGKTDGTHIKFIGNARIKNESKVIKQMNFMRHSTPGVISPSN